MMIDMSVFDFVAKYIMLLFIGGVVLFMVFGIHMKHFGLYQYSCAYLVVYIFFACLHPNIVNTPKNDALMEKDCTQLAKDCSKLLSKYFLTKEQHEHFSEAVHYFCLEKLDCEKGKEYICRHQRPIFSGTDQVKAFKYKHRVSKCHEWNIPVTHFAGRQAGKLDHQRNIK